MKNLCMYAVVPLLLAGLGCAVLRSTRLGGMTGYADATDGHRDIRAVTLSVRPFAEMEDAEPDPMTDRRFDEVVAQRDLARSQLDLACTQLDAYAFAAEADERMWSEHFCATVEHVDSTETPWYGEESFLLWLSGFAAMLCGFIFRKPLGAVARKAVGRGDPPA